MITVLDKSPNVIPLFPPFTEPKLISPACSPDQPDHQPKRPRLVAHWFRDENNQLYCQWIKE